MHEYIVKSANRITSRTLLLDLEQKSSLVSFMYQPGQYVGVSYYNNGNPTQARCFTVVSSPTTHGKLQLCMRINGNFTKAAALLQPGDLVEISGPYGDFVLDISSDKGIVFLAGGIGIAPFMSMLSYASSIKSPTKITMFYSCRDQEDVPFLDELRDLERQNHNIKIVYVISDGPTNKLDGLSCVTGRLTPDVLDSSMKDHYTNRVFYICGPPSYMNAMTQALKLKGVDNTNIIFEAFD